MNNHKRQKINLKYLHVFYTLLDAAWTSLNECFEQFKTYDDNFSFFYKVFEIESKELKRHCENIENLLKDDS